MDLLKYSSRLIDSHLLDWKDTRQRKPLLLRGARQVGKSSTIRHLGTKFESYFEINFESMPEVRPFFSDFGKPELILEKLSIYFGKTIEQGKSLLFLDEIQAYPEALNSLRYFYEKIPDLHVIAAGSLLEFALQELPSFGVGRIRSLFLYPFSFDEFLMAIGEKKLMELKNSADQKTGLEPAFHNKLNDYLRKFMVIGGMPEVVAKYAQGSSILEIQSVLDDLNFSFQDDFAKYKSRMTANRIFEVFQSVVFQMGGKYIFSKSVESLSDRQVQEAVQLLMLSGLVIPVTHTSANGIPAGAEANPKKRKMLVLDTGLYQRLLQLELSQVWINEDITMVNKGNLAELFTGLEWLKYGNPYERESLYYWHRETSNSNAEVDYVVQIGASLVPVEVKSSGKGRMQSMHRFMDEKKSERGIRISMENFGHFNQIDVVPLYAIHKIRLAKI
jgi:predicted AAA+ superfamily ATPase